MPGLSSDSRREAIPDLSDSTAKINPTVIAKTSCTTLQITSHKLNGKLYLQRSRSTVMLIRGKGKMNFLDGSITRPITKTEYPNWGSNNFMVMAWLVHSMEESSGDTYLFYTTAKEIWGAMSLHILTSKTLHNYSSYGTGPRTFAKAT